MVPTPLQISLIRALRTWWKDRRERQGLVSALRMSVGDAWEFLRDSTAERRRQRYGGVEYDWEYRMDTTSATVRWRDRLLGLLHSPYQATEPTPFEEMLARLKIDVGNFS